MIWVMSAAVAPFVCHRQSLKGARDHIDDPGGVLFEQDDIAKNNHPSQVPRQGRQFSLKGRWKRLSAFPQICRKNSIRTKRRRSLVADHLQRQCPKLRLTRKPVSNEGGLLQSKRRRAGVGRHYRSPYSQDVNAISRYSHEPRSLEDSLAGRALNLRPDYKTRGFRQGRDEQAHEQNNECTLQRHDR